MLKFIFLCTQHIFLSLCFIVSFIQILCFYLNGSSNFNAVSPPQSLFYFVHFFQQCNMSRDNRIKGYYSLCIPPCSSQIFTIQFLLFLHPSFLNAETSVFFVFIINFINLVCFSQQFGQVLQFLFSFFQNNDVLD